MSKIIKSHWNTRINNITTSIEMLKIQHNKLMFIYGDEECEEDNLMKQLEEVQERVINLQRYINQIFNLTDL